ncbi:MAG: hypothetical protein MR598_03790 [Erysipelotrichaceae bacterium]|nr:hypothetical protein [Erysipelotrichaceae bacterium]
MEDMIYIEDLLKFYLKRIGFVILVTLLFVELGLLKAENSYQEYYQESTTIILVNPVDEEGTQITGSGSLDKYLTLLESKKLATNVISNLQLDTSTSALLGQATFTMATNSQMITITISDESDELAASIANTYVAELKKEVNSIYRVDNIMVLDEAVPTNNKIITEKNNTLLFALAGFVISSGIIISIYCFNENIRIMLRKEPILGVEILKTTYFKKKENLFEINKKNQEKLKKIKSMLYKAQKENQIKTIMITSESNHFQSNYSVSLATSYIDITRKVLLIDCNRLGKLSQQNEEGLLDLIKAPANTFNNKLKKYTKYLEEVNIHLLPLGNLEKHDINEITDPNFIKVLSKIKDQYDIVFIEVPDVSSSFEGMVLSDLLDATIVVMNKNKVTTNKIKQFSDAIDKEKNKFIAIAPVKVKRSINIKKNNIFKKFTIKKKIHIFKKISLKKEKKNI